jgi:hypothetical protein
MSAYDDLFAAIVQPSIDKAAHPDLAGLVGAEISALELKRIAKALEIARANEGQALPEQYWLPDYPGQMTDLSVDGVVVGSHGLTLVEGHEVYSASFEVVGRALPLLVRRRRLLRGAVEELQLAHRFGSIQRLGLETFDRSFLLRCSSRAAAVAFLTDEFVNALVSAGRDLVDVVVLPDEKSAVSVRVRVDGAKSAAGAIALARATFKAARLVAPKVFVASGEARELSHGDVLDLVQRVRDATSFLAGDVERVGEGVEARLLLDEPEELEARLRLEVVDDGLRLSFRGALPVAPRKPVTLSPEVGVWKKALGLVDPKVGDEALDRAFLVDGDLDAAKLVLTERNAALRLCGRGAVLSAAPEGFGVAVACLPREDEAVLDVVVASISAWREAALACAGFARPPGDEG